MFRSLKLVTAAALLLAVLVIPLHAEEIQIRTTDGVLLRGTWRAAEGGGERTALLLHMLGRTRADFEPLVAELLAQGISSFAIDFRGHGESVKQAGSEAVLNYREFDHLTWPGILKDVAPAIQFIESKGVTRSSITIVGGSIGANAAVIAASGDRQVRAAVLLSPGMDYRGLRIGDALDGWGNRPLLVLATSGDTYSLSTAQKIRDRFAGQNRVKVEIYPGQTAHGTELFTGVPGATKKIADWIVAN